MTRPQEPDDRPVPDDRLSRDMRRNPSRYPKFYWRALDYEVERVRAANQPAVMSVDRDAFLQEVEADRAVSRELIRAVVRAFTVTTLRGPAAATPNGWRDVVQAVRNVVGTAIRMGIEDVRPTSLNMPVPPPVPRVPPIPSWAVMIYEKRRPTDREIEADIAYWQGLPVRLVEAMVRAHVRARFQEPGGATPEGRSRVLQEVRRDLWDAILDAVKTVPRPSSTPSPLPGQAPQPQLQSPARA